MKRYKFENLLIAFLINRQKYCLLIVDGKSDMGRYKFENLLMAFLINTQQSYLSLKKGKYVISKSARVCFLHQKSARVYFFSKE